MTVNTDSAEADAPGRPPGRPVTTSRKAIEHAAIALMVEHGYDAVSVTDIAEAAGVGRTTVFRVFGSKQGIIWSSFDEINGWLSDAFAQNETDDALDRTRLAIRTSTRRTLDATEVWSERFGLIDTAESLRPEAARYWEQWRGVIAEHLAGSTGLPADGAVIQAIAGAAQAVFVADLRTTARGGADAEALLTAVDADLGVVFGALRSLLPSAP